MIYFFMKKENLTEDRERIIDFINTNEVFWLEDLRRHMGCLTADNYSDIRNCRIGRVIRVLKIVDIIQCCQVSGVNRQFIVINPKNKIVLSEIDFSQ